ncbi:MAG: putative hydroxymethylpyrimidine transport system substrate-binding protein, partial [Solirubrobacteraceae bacterium]|nr:putative hydroxymethylpyrimidine transport system substrate-binding protein [Solirubrobacteraceae bacterium]
MRLVLRAVPVALVAALALAGCGSSSPGSALPQLTIALDFTPNAVHAPIYAAIRDGLDRKQGVRLHIRTPGASPDSLKDVLSGAA